MHRLRVIPWLALIALQLAFVVGCGQQSSEAVAQPASSEPAAGEDAAEIAIAPGEQATQQTAAEPVVESPAKKRQRAHTTAARVKEVMDQAGREGATPEETELLARIEQQQEVYGLLAQDIADEQANPGRDRLFMPWDLSAGDLMKMVPGSRGVRPRRSFMSSQLSAAIGAEQLDSVASASQQDSFALANLRARRAWQNLSESEQAACREFLSDFAAEASGENARQLEELGAKLSTNPKDADALAARAQLQWQRGDLNSASADFRQAVAADSKNKDQIRLQYAQLLEEMGEAFQAKTEYQQIAHSESPLSREAYICWGYVLLREQRTDAAMSAVEQALKIDPNSAAAHLLAAEVYQQAGLPQLIITSLEKAIEAEPEDAQLHYRLGNIYSQLQRPEEARLAYDRAIELAPEWWRPLAGRATLKFQADDKEGALADLTAAKELAPEEPSVVGNRAYVLEALGRAEEAKAEYESAERLGDD